MLDHPHNNHNFNSQWTRLHLQCCLLNRFRLIHIQLTLRKKIKWVFKVYFFYLSKNSFFSFSVLKDNSSIPTLAMSNLFDLQVAVVITIMPKIKVIILPHKGSFKPLKHLKLEFLNIIVAIVIIFNNSKSSRNILSHPLPLLILKNSIKHILISNFFILK